MENQSAQMEVYNRFYKAMYNASYRIVNDRALAEDIMQDSFLTAFTKLDKLKEAKIFGSWLKKIVINNSIHHYQKTNSNHKIPIEDVLYKIEHEKYKMDFNEEENSLRVKQVLNTLSTLKDNYRIVLTLNLIEGYDYEEISTIMKISYANCRTMISRAKEKLRSKLKLQATY